MSISNDRVVFGLYNYGQGWNRLLKDAGAVRWASGQYQGKTVEEWLQEDMDRFKGLGGTDLPGSEFYTLAQAKKWREKSQAWKCLCRGDVPRYRELVY